MSWSDTCACNEVLIFVYRGSTNLRAPQNCPFCGLDSLVNRIIPKKEKTKSETESPVKSHPVLTQSVDLPPKKSGKKEKNPKDTVFMKFLRVFIEFSLSFHRSGHRHLTLRHLPPLLAYQKWSFIEFSFQILTLILAHYVFFFKHSAVHFFYFISNKGTLNITSSHYIIIIHHRHVDAMSTSHIIRTYI